VLTKTPEAVAPEPNDVHVGDATDKSAISPTSAPVANVEDATDAKEIPSETQTTTA